MAAKRFTDTGKWDKESFDGLTSKMKLVWIYLCDKCDHAGIWDINLKLMTYHLGEPIDIAEIKMGLGDKVKVLSDTKLFLPSFVEFQYGELNPENRVHQSVLFRLKKEGAYKGLISSIQGAKDKEKEKDKDKVSFEKGTGEKLFKPDLDSIYKRYPRKEGKARGLAILAGSIKTASDENDCHRALDAFIAHHKTKGTERDFFPHFKTWAGSWRDCLDPDFGHSEDFSNSTGIDYAARERAIFEGAS